MKRMYTTQQVSAKQLINPKDIREGDIIEACFPNGEVECGIAVLEKKPDYHSRYKRRMMLCTDGAKRGHVITGWAGFPAGTQFYKLTPGEAAACKQSLPAGTQPEERAPAPENRRTI